MPSMNVVVLVGNLTRDPETRFTPQGAGVCKFSLAVNRQWKDASGEKKEAVDFFNIVVWGKPGENCQKYLTKGRPVAVNGRLQTRTWEKDGQKHHAVDVVADNVLFLNSGRATGSDPQAQEAGGADPSGGSGDLPF